VRSRPSAPRRADIARTVLVVVAGIIVGLFVVHLVGRLSRPYRVLWRQRGELRTLTAQVEAEGRERDRLRRDIARMRTPEGLLLEARRLGYVRSGERMLRYVEPENWPRAQRPQPPPSRVSRLKQRVHRILDSRERTLTERQRAQSPGD
jgi:hypothetical protein